MIRGRRLLPRADLTDEAIAAAVCGLDEVRRLRVVVEGLAQLSNGDFEHGLADEGLRPDGIEKLLFGDELAWPPEEVAEQGEGFGPELDGLRASPEALVSEVQAKAIEDYPVVAFHTTHQTLPKFYRGSMTDHMDTEYSPPRTVEWQSIA